MHKDGILFVFHSAHKLEKSLKHLEPLAKYDIVPSAAYWGKEVRELEPALAPAINGGFWFSNDRSVRPDTVTAGLTEWLTERNVEIRTNTRVVELIHLNGQVNAVQNHSGEDPGRCGSDRGRGALR